MDSDDDGNISNFALPPIEMDLLDPNARPKPMSTILQLMSDPHSMDPAEFAEPYPPVRVLEGRVGDAGGRVFGKATCSTKVRLDHVPCMPFYLELDVSGLPGGVVRVVCGRPSPGKEGGAFVARVEHGQVVVTHTTDDSIRIVLSVAEVLEAAAAAKALRFGEDAFL